MFRADVFDGLVNHLLEFVRGNVGESFAGFADGLMKDAPADSLLGLKYRPWLNSFLRSPRIIVTPRFLRAQKLERKELNGDRVRTDQEQIGQPAFPC